MSSAPAVLVTSALPYANGPIHLGHLVEYIQTDIWVRFRRMRGEQCVYLCADDTHGTPIMLRAEHEGITPEALIGRVAIEHQRDFADFGIGFDQFHSTHSEENRRLSEWFFDTLTAGGHIEQRVVRQPYDREKAMFLPDRFVRGECPRCGANDQYGDSCEVCGATYDPADLKNPVSALTGTVPEWRDSDHFFFRLGDFAGMLRAWTRSGVLQAETANKLDEWLAGELRAWDISRDAPYFGFQIPGHPGKFFYVWLDAPIGYLASLWAYLERTTGGPVTREVVLGAWNGAEVHHFIGKDILYFHALFWPAMLEATGYAKPAGIHAHGFLTVNGQKMSKSRGTFIKARTYLNHLPPEPLRYYLAAKLNGRVEDIDLNLEDFTQRVNADLVGKIVNIASRLAGLLARHHDNRLGERLADDTLFAQFAAAAHPIAEAYLGRDFSRAIRDITTLADSANQYIDTHKPWDLAKTPERHGELVLVCTQGLNLFRVLMVYLKPVLPALVGAAEHFLAIEPLLWSSAATPLLSHHISHYQHLMQRITPEAVAALKAEAAADGQTAQPTVTSANAGTSPGTTDGALATIEDFAKLDLRIAKILSAETIDGSDKLLRLAVTLDGTTTRQILAGIRASYPDPSVLTGRLVLVVANLAPRKMRFGVSEGMVLAAGGEDRVWVLSPDAGASAGARVR